jgi:hypothetical protein
MAQSFLDMPGYPLGLRNNNPGNLRPLGSTKWIGEIEPDYRNNFSRFSDVAYGLRAMITDITGDIVGDGLNTLQKLITAYAPPGDNNNTSAYIKSVSDSTGIAPNAILQPTRETIEKLIKGKLNVELGPAYAKKINQEDINQAFDRLSDNVKSWIIPTAAAAGGGLVLIIALAVIFRKQLGI